MPDTVPTVLADLPRYIRAFFDQIALPADRGGAGLAREQMTNLTVFAGAYTRYPTSGAGFPSFGLTLRPDHAIRVCTTALTAGDGTFAVAGVSFDEGRYAWQDLRYLMELGDAATDDAATLERLLRHVEDGPAWARALAGAPNRAALYGRRLTEITDVPAGAPSGADAGALRLLLARHFTYTADGAYYAKYEGGTAFPANISAAYKTNALQEIHLYRDEVYVYGILPERSVDPAAPAGRMREFLARFHQPTPDAPLALREIYGAPRADSDTPFHQFCFFGAPEGRGVTLSPSARAALDPSLATFLAGVPDDNIQAYLDRCPGLGAPQGMVQFAAYVSPGSALANLPPGVQVGPAADGVGADAAPLAAEDADEDPVPGGMVRLVTAPVGQLAAFAGRDDVVWAQAQGYAEITVDNASTTVKRPQLLSAMGVTGGGEGVIVGIIDTGIDGAHPAFTGRILKVWDQHSTAAAGTAPSVTGHPEISGGKVFSTAADITANAQDTIGHGTHVAGAAAGAASGTAYPYDGMAPKAKLLIVRAGQRNPGSQSWGFPDPDIIQGIQWILHEAGTTPVVINMSLGGHFFQVGTNFFPHGHDGTQALAVRIRDEIRTFDTAGRPNGWKRGKVIVASTGNERQRRMHTHTDSVAPGAVATFDVTVRATRPGPPPTPEPPVTSDATLSFYCRPIPANRRGCRVRVRVQHSGAAGGTGWVEPEAGPVPTARLSNVSGPVVSIANGPLQPFTQHRAVHVLLHGSAAAPITPGTWRVSIENLDDVPVEIHGYSGASTQFGAAVFFANATQRAIIGNPAVAAGILAIASESDRASWTDIAGTVHQNSRAATDANNLPIFIQNNQGVLSTFSSPGPVRGTRRGVATTAPGGALISARSSQAVPDGAGNAVSTDGLISATAVVMSGTSMASPIVTGLIACALEKEHGLDTETIRTRLRTTHRPIPGASNAVQDAADWGPGPIDATGLHRP